MVAAQPLLRRFPIALAMTSWAAVASASQLASANNATSLWHMQGPQAQLSPSRVLRGAPPPLVLPSASFDPPLPQGTAVEDVIWVSHLLPEAPMTALRIRDINTTLGNGSALPPPAVLDAPSVLSANASEQLGQWLRLDVHLRGVHFDRVPEGGLRWSMGSNLTLGGLSYPGVVVLLHRGEVSCSCQADGWQCTMAVYCATSASVNGSTCPTNMQSAEVPSWWSSASHANGPGHVLLVVHAIPGQRGDAAVPRRRGGGKPVSPYAVQLGTVRPVGVQSIADGSRFAVCASLDDLSLWCWGSGRVGQTLQLPGLTDAALSTMQRPRQVQVHEWQALGIGVQSVYAGSGHFCSIMSDGSLWCWGENSQGQLGVGSTVSSEQPLRVKAGEWGGGGKDHMPAVNAVKSTSSGASFGRLTLLEDGTVWFWGMGREGSLGDGDATAHNVLSPQQMDMQTWGQPGSSPRIAVSTQGEKREKGGCVLLLDGTLWCWGRNWAGMVGDGTYELRKSPVQVTVANMSVVSVSGGGAHSCAILTDTSLWCWGLSTSGQVGVPSAGTGQPLPVRVQGDIWGGINSSVGVVSVSCGTRATCALLSNGDVYCWGDVDMSTHSTVPDPIPEAYTPQIVDAAAWGGAPVRQVNAGFGSACVVTADAGALWCWGRGEHGRLGIGSVDTHHHAVSVTHANTNLWSCVESHQAGMTSLVSGPPSLAYVVAGPAVPGVRLCAPGVPYGGAALPPWSETAAVPGSTKGARDRTGDGRTSASWHQVYTSVSTALHGTWPAATATLPAVQLLRTFMQRSNHANNIHIAAVRWCSASAVGTNASWEGRWGVYPWMSPCAGCSTMQHASTIALQAQANASACDTPQAECDAWQLAMVVAPPLHEVPLLLHGAQQSVPLDAAWLLLLDVPAGLRFRVLGAQVVHADAYGRGGHIPSEGGVLIVFLDVSLLSPVDVRVSLRRLGQGGKPCDVHAVDGAVVECTVGGGAGVWQLHVEVDGHAADAHSSVHVQYATPARQVAPVCSR